ncbi:UDP-N-acetylmuramate dehydrogenase [Patescibacteria group bacterium]|nr:UDP-N-acetylmuramate dehydrogenase [Patescibacteria group bacterium]
MISEQQHTDFITAYPSVLQNESMAAHTYLKIGGPARLFFVASTSDELVGAVEFAVAHQIPWYVIGGGSNLLVSDDGFDGVVIQAADRQFSIEGQRVTSAPGIFTGLLANATVTAGLTGFEWGAGVPGTIGGATYGNAGCFGGEMKDAVVSVKAYDVRQAKRVTYTSEECRFGYRDSRFKHESHLILKIIMELKPDVSGEGRKKIDEIIAKRKDTQPQGAFSAGCLFKNFEYGDESALEKLKREVDEIPAAMLQNKTIAAGWLIDKVGLKGKTIGKAQVSPVHGNFLVNLGGARAQDVIMLSSLVKMKVRDELGVLLEDEVQYLGF